MPESMPGWTPECETGHGSPVAIAWPADFVRRYREAGHWRGDTLHGFLRDRALLHGSRTAIVGGTQRWSYAELWRRAGSVAAGLLSLGLRPGERVVVQLGNIPEFYSAVFGLFRAGMLPVYALPAHRALEIGHLVERSGAAALITASDLGPGADGRSIACAVRTTRPTLRQVVVVGDAAGCTAFDALGAGAPPPPWHAADPQSVAFLQISSGSTGLPKLIPRTHDDYVYSFRASADICALGADSVYLVVLPCAHNFPMSSPGAFGALHAGGTVVLSTSVAPDTAFALIERERVTDLGVVPPLALLWADAAGRTGRDLSSLRVLQVGGAKLTPEAARRVSSAFGCRLQQVFGMAEGLVNYTRLDDDEHTVLHTQGRPISQDDEIRIVGDDGRAVPDGQPGQLQVRGPYTIRGYFNDDAANVRAFTPDGFYRTGDVVRRLPSGHLVVEGRVHDHVNRAGEKVSAEEVEDHLLAHPDVFDAAVVAVRDGYLGERVCAVVVPRGGALPRVPELKAWMRERGLATFKVPDQFVFTSAFPLNPIGKTSRKALREQLRAQFLDKVAQP